jgi:hypothetical protein
MANPVPLKDEMDFQFSRMMKKYERRTFSCMCRESPFEKQRVLGDSLLTRGCRQGAEGTFAQLQRGFASTLLGIIGAERY